MVERGVRRGVRQTTAGGLGLRMQKPPEFGWSIPYPIFRHSADDYVVDIDPTSLRPTTGVSLYVSPSGNNANTGLSWAQAKRSIYYAVISMNNALDGNPAYGPATIYVEGGATYDYTNGFRGLTPGDDSFSIIPVDRGNGLRIRATTSRLDLTWGVVGGASPNVYSASLAAAPYSVVDELSPTSQGLGSRLTLQTTVSGVQANPGSYFHSASVIYVRTSDSRAPDASLHPFEGDGAGGGTYNMLINNAAVTTYVENVDFLGGGKGAYMLNGTLMTLVDCTVRYCDTEGIRTHIADAVMVRCRSQENGGDGLAYTSTNGSRALEVDCVGSENGYGVSETSNGSTMHNAGWVVRVGGTYERNKGQNVVDVNDSHSWCLGCTARGTRATIASQKTNFYADGLMWLRDCTSDPTGMGYELYAEDAEDRILLFDTSAYVLPIGGLGTVGEYRY